MLTMDSRGQCVARCACLLPQLTLIPNYTAWCQGQQYV